MSNPDPYDADYDPQDVDHEHQKWYECNRERYTNRPISLIGDL